MVKKNPNRNPRIVVLVKRMSNVNLPSIPLKLTRRLEELLETAKVRSTQYDFTVKGVGHRLQDKTCLAVTLDSLSTQPSNSVFQFFFLMENSM